MIINHKTTKYQNFYFRPANIQKNILNTVIFYIVFKRICCGTFAKLLINESLTKHSQVIVFILPPKTIPLHRSDN